MARELPSVPRLVLGTAIVGCVALIGFLGSGSATRRAPPPASSPEWSAPGRSAAVDSLRAPAVPPAVETHEPEAHDATTAGPPAGTTSAAPVPRGVLRLQGDVFLQDGRAAASARIVVGRHNERCDARGHYEFTLESVPEDADLIAFLGGYEPARITRYGARFAVGASEDHVRLVLGPASKSIAGAVIDEEGRPHKNWLVELAGDDPLGIAIPRDVVRTDGSGSFRVPDVPEGWFALRVRRSPHDEGFVTQEFEAGTEEARVVLPD